MLKQCLVVLLFVVILSHSGWCQGRYWVELTDKSIAEREFQPGALLYDEVLSGLSSAAITRRKRISPNGNTLTIADAPIAAEYCNKIISIGAKIIAKSKWTNSLCIEADESLIPTIQGLSFVKNVCQVLRAKCMETEESCSPFLPQDGAIVTHRNAPQVLPIPFGYDSIIYNYGYSHNQLVRHNILPLHAMGFDAAGVRLGFMDTGFRWEAMTATKTRNIIDEYDFVYRDTITSDDERDTKQSDGHGSVVLAAATAYYPDSIVGAAYNAEILLAKTEDIRSETPIEEQYYAESIEWMESRGAQIVSTSLAYFRYDSGFVSHTYADLDGKTTISARAASHAAKLGMLLVVAMGNNGSDTIYSKLNTPADADSILSVGAIRPDELIAGYSAKGPTADGRLKPEICAQGVDVWTSTNLDSIRVAGGTSLAAPLVSSACALIMQAHPEASAQQVRSAVMKTGQRIVPPDTVYGYGKLDAYNAALELGTIIGTIRHLREDSIHSVCVGAAANNGITSARIVYAVNEGGSFSGSIPLSLIKDSLIYAATFPELAKGSHVRFFVEVVDGADTVTRLPRNAPDSVLDFFVGDSIPNPPFNVASEVEPHLISVYPNPVRDVLTIRSAAKRSLYFTLYNSLGESIVEFETTQFLPTIRITTDGISSGAYLLIGRSAAGESLLHRHIIVSR